MKRSEFKQLIRRELIKEAKGTSYESKLAEIEKQGKMVTLETKIDALSEMIETKNNRLSLVNEDENLADLVDKKKIKEMQKEIKLLEKAKTKMEKVFEKMGGVRTEVTSGDTVEAGMTEDTSDQVATDDAEDAAEEASEGLGENLTSEHQGYDDKEDESLGMEDGPEKDYTQSEKDRREDRYGKWGKRDSEHRGASLEESLSEEFLRMQKLSGIISEEEYKNRLNENKFRKKIKHTVLESIFDKVAAAVKGKSDKEKASIEAMKKFGIEVGKPVYQFAYLPGAAEDNDKALSYFPKLTPEQKEKHRVPIPNGYDGPIEKDGLKKIVIQSLEEGEDGTVQATTIVGDYNFGTGKFIDDDGPFTTSIENPDQIEKDLGEADANDKMYTQGLKMVPYNGSLWQEFVDSKN